MTRMATLRSNNAKMEVAIQSKDAAINEIQNNLKKQIELTRNLQSGLQRIELENTRITVSYTHLTLPTICSV